MTFMGRGKSLAVAAALCGGLLAATAAHAQEKATLQLNWFGSGDHTPLYLAKKLGYYTAEKIDLTIVRGTGSGDSVKRLELKQADFGIADTPTVITGISKGADLVIVGMVFDKAGNNAFFYKDSGIKSPKDLVGKKIALPPGDSHRVLWPAFAKANGIDPDSVTMVNVKPEGKQAIVAAKEVDLSFDLYTGYPLWEKVLGQGKVGNMLWADHGLQLYGLSYFVHRDTLKEKPEMVRGFLRATYKGWAEAQKNPAAAVDAMVADIPGGIDRGSLLAAMPYVMELCVTDRSRKNGLGWIDADLMQKSIDITYSGGKMDKNLKAAEVFTNDFNSKVMPAK